MPNERWGWSGGGDGDGVEVGMGMGVGFLKIPKRANKSLKCICTAMYCISSQ